MCQLALGGLRDPDRRSMRRRSPGASPRAPRTPMRPPAARRGRQPAWAAGRPRAERPRRPGPRAPSWRGLRPRARAAATRALAAIPGRGAARRPPGAGRGKMLHERALSCNAGGTAEHETTDKHRHMTRATNPTPTNAPAVYTPLRVARSRYNPMQRPCKLMMKADLRAHKDVRLVACACNVSSWVFPRPGTQNRWKEVAYRNNQGDFVVHRPRRFAVCACL